MSGVNPTAAQLRQLKRDNLKYGAALAAVPRTEWPVAPFVEVCERVGLFRSRAFCVQVVREQSGHLRMSVNRTEWDERRKSWREDISWDDLQRLKAEAGFGDAWAVEVFPPDASVVNVANMRHLFILDDQPAFGWHGRRQVAA